MKSGQRIKDAAERFGTRIKLAALWAVVFDITFADIIGSLYLGALERMMNGSVGFGVTPALLLFFVLLEVLIMMILLCPVLPADKWLN